MTVKVGVSVGSGVAVPVNDGTGVNVAVGVTWTGAGVGVAVGAGPDIAGAGAALQEARMKATARLIPVSFGNSFFRRIVHLNLKDLCAYRIMQVDGRQPVERN